MPKTNAFFLRFYCLFSRIFFSENFTAHLIWRDKNFKHLSSACKGSVLIFKNYMCFTTVEKVVT